MDLLAETTGGDRRVETVLRAARDFDDSEQSFRRPVGGSKLFGRNLLEDRAVRIAGLLRREERPLEERGLSGSADDSFQLDRMISPGETEVGDRRRLFGRDSQYLLAVDDEAGGAPHDPKPVGPVLV